jgi:transcriptional regulator with XRE-family HTH domain
MQANIQKPDTPTYQTITGGHIPLSGLADAEFHFLEKVAKKYNARQDWTRFAAWWNAEFNAAGLTTSSPLYRICQDLEARLGITQGKVAPPDYRDYLAVLIDTQFGSRQDFCKATEVDPGQLSRVLASRADLSMKVLQKILEVLHARLVVQTDEESRVQTSIDKAAAAIREAVSRQDEAGAANGDDALEHFEPALSLGTVQRLIDEQIRPLREQVKRLESRIQAGENVA